MGGGLQCARAGPLHQLTEQLNGQPTNYKPQPTNERINQKRINIFWSHIATTWGLLRLPLESRMSSHTRKHTTCLQHPKSSVHLLLSDSDAFLQERHQSRLLLVSLWATHASYKLCVRTSGSLPACVQPTVHEQRQDAKDAHWLVKSKTKNADSVHSVRDPCRMRRWRNARKKPRWKLSGFSLPSAMKMRMSKKRGTCHGEQRILRGRNESCVQCSTPKCDWLLLLLHLLLPPLANRAPRGSHHPPPCAHTHTDTHIKTKQNTFYDFTWNEVWSDSFNCNYHSSQSAFSCSSSLIIRPKGEFTKLSSSCLCSRKRRHHI